MKDRVSITMLEGGIADVVARQLDVRREPKPVV